MRVSPVYFATVHLVWAISFWNASATLPDGSIRSAMKDWLGDVYGKVYDKVCGGRNMPKSQCQRKAIKECTCFEVLQTNSIRVQRRENINVGDIKRGYRIASKFYHPDKGGTNDDFQFLESCYTNFKDSGTRGKYQALLENLEQNKRSQRWGDHKFRSTVDQLNEMFGI